MKPTELRIGNLLRDAVTKTELQVIELTKEDIICHVIDRSKFPLQDGWSLDPIPITVDNILDFKFEEIENNHPFANHRAFEKSGLHIKIYYSTHTKAIWYNGFHLKNCILFVHELQNLFYALTGEELTVNN